MRRMNIPMQHPSMEMGQMMGQMMCPMAMHMQHILMLLNNINMTVHMNNMILRELQEHHNMEME